MKTPRTITVRGVLFLFLNTTGNVDKLEFSGESPQTIRYGLRWSNDILWARSTVR